MILVKEFMELIPKMNGILTIQ